MQKVNFREPPDRKVPGELARTQNQAGFCDGDCQRS